MTFEPKRLHISAILFIALKTIKESIVIIFSLIFIIGRIDFFNYVILGMALMVAGIILFSWLKWLRFKYALDEDGLKIEQGIIIRHHRSISKHRIQSINFSQTIIHRMFGLTEVQIETAGSDMEVDAKLSALTQTEAKQLRKALKSSNAEQAIDETTEDAQYDYDYALKNNLPRFEISYKRLFIFGSTSGGFGLIFAVVLFIMNEAEVFVPDDIYETTTNWLFAQAVTTLIILIVLFLLFTWLIGVLGSVVKYGDFTIIRYSDELYITRGLWEKKQLTIPLKRIQAIGFKQNPLRLPFDLGFVYVEIAGGEVETGQNNRTIVFPLLRRKELTSFFESLVPEYATNFDEIKPISKRLFAFYSGIVTLILVLPIGALLYFVPNLWWIGLIVYGLAILYSYFTYKMMGFYQIDNQLCMQSFLLGSKQIIFMKKRRIQAFEKRQSLLQKRINIASIQASIMNNFIGQHYSVSGLTETQIGNLSDWYSYQDEYKLEDIDQP
ncbi:putative membrane protein [Pelagirhabdus alkalitolerans]|uniref:Putative membrane protein n=1 Tax=Pelagirhabdus alkalitolerans TaxID=1612202 RepID=A0A1G6KML3_9BACI|nr:PH domain-containing protein [Pelagirhabdus alkalitolerans]SDC31765.1 putative membrane protein [Pelagirhabdus alkalitolerans]